MDADDKIIVLGSPESGKTTYISLALARLIEMSGSDAGFWLHTTNEVAEQYTKRYVEAFKTGTWCRKTSSHLDCEFFMEHRTALNNPWVPDWIKISMLPNQRRTIRITDVAGEYCRASKQHGLDFTGIVGRMRESEYLMIMVDAEKIYDDDGEVRDTLQGCVNLIQRRMGGGDPSFYIHFVFTKCDVLERDPYYYHDGAYDANRMRWEFMSKYCDILHPQEKCIVVGGHWIYCDCTCVSCIPVKEHREFDPEYGVRPKPGAWQLSDMHHQLWPFLCIFDRMPVNWGFSSLF